MWALLRTNHDVYLYEAADRLGGHTNTVRWEKGKYSVGVDTGFIVLNTATYRKCTLSLTYSGQQAHITRTANFINFLKKMRVETERTKMEFGVSRDSGSFEWAGTSLGAVFCQPRNILSLRMWRMLFDIVRFNQFALDILINGVEGGVQTIGQYLERNGYSDAFRDDYLIPVTAAIWSTGPNTCIDEFPLLTLVRFL